MRLHYWNGDYATISTWVLPPLFIAHLRNSGGHPDGRRELLNILASIISRAKSRSELVMFAVFFNKMHDYPIRNR